MKALRTLLLTLAACVLLLIGGCVALPDILHWSNPSVVYRVPGAGRTLFLTLDDGPSAATPQILDVLKKHDVHATFFITTDHITPEAMKRIAAGGHQIANHLKATRDLGRLTEAQFHADFQEAHRALAPYEPAKLFRPPGGSISDAQAKYVTAQGYSIVVGTVFPLDHWLESLAAIEFLSKTLVIDGGIIILHDTDSRGPRTAAVLDRLLPQLKQKGYRFALLPKL